MAKAAKTEPTREELLAQLETLDRQDELHQRDTEIAALKATVEKVTRERDGLSSQVSELSTALKGIHEVLKPYSEALESPIRGGLYRGRRVTPRATPVPVEKPLDEAPATEEVKTTKRPKKDPKGLAAHFPDLSEDGPGEVVEAED